jgi:hypothetical protein
MFKPPFRWIETTVRIERVGSKESKVYEDGHWTEEEEFIIHVQSCGERDSD